MLSLRKTLIIAVAAAAISLSTWLWFRNGHKLDTVNALWGVIAGIVTLIVALVPWASKSPELVTTDHITDTLGRLASAVRIQWREEAEIRGLLHPIPLLIEWSTADASLTDRTSRVMDHLSPSGLAEHHDQNLLTGKLPEISSTFRSIPSQRLMVIGEPGAGKTIVALMLTLELLQQRRPSEPVPILFPIGSWNPLIQHLHAWMASWLEETYVWLRAPGPVAGVTLALWLVQTCQILPVLDGLDEMPDNLRPEAIRSLNRTLSTSPLTGQDPLVLTCRTREYIQIIEPDPSASPSGRDIPALPLAGATVIELYPLRVDDITRYLLAATPEFIAHKWDAVIAVLREEPGGQLAQALSTPLMTAMARDTFGLTDHDPNVLLAPNLVGREMIEDFLLKRLIPSLYPDTPLAPGNARWDTAKVGTWFRFLARCLQHRATRNFFWWESPMFMPRPIYWMLYGVTAGLTSAIVFEILVGPVAAVFVGTITAAATAIVGPVVGVSSPSPLSIRLRTGIPRFALGFAIGLVIGIIVEFSLGLSATTALVAGIPVGFFGGLAAGLVFLLEQPVDVTQATNPRSLLVSDRTALLLRAFGVAPLAGIAIALAIGLRSELGLTGGERVAVVVGLGVCLGAAVVVGLRTRILIGIVAGIALGLLSTTVVWVALSHGHTSAITLSVTSGIWVWLEIALTLSFTSAWGSYMLGRTWCAIRGHLPWSLMSFLDDAHKRGVLRQIGAAYQFRHAALQDQLALPEPGTVLRPPRTPSFFRRRSSPLAGPDQVS